MNHIIKILEDFADAVVSGEKTFEIRENDRGYQKGDYVVFKTIPGHPIEQKVYKITYVINGWGLKNGYVAFGIKEVKVAVSGIIEDIETSSVDPEQYKDAFTDIEKRIFYAAIGRERNICKYTDEEWDRHEYGSPSINLESVCNSIKRKVTRSDLWRVEVEK